MAGDIVAQIVQQNLGVYRAAPPRLQEDVSQEAQVASDYRGRLVYELLQNADDAMEGQATQHDRVAFSVTDDALWMANSGRPLTEADVQGLCGLGASSKIDAAGTRRAAIGHKGLGFKSVLEITEAPQVFSRTHSFRLGASEALPHVEQLWSELGYGRPRSVPAMRFPSKIPHPDSEPRWSKLSGAGFNTAFLFPFHSDLAVAQRTSLADRLVELPLTTVLFLKNLETVVVEVDQTGRSERREWSIKREILHDGDWLPVSGLGGSGTYRVSVSSTDDDVATFYVAHDANVSIGPNRVGLSGPAWDGVDLTEVSIAALTPETRDEMPQEWRHFHVFLPTEEPCPYPMLVNGAFATDLSRQQIRLRPESEDYNSHLIKEAARLFVQEMLPILMVKGAESVLHVLDRGENSTGGDAASLLHSSLAESLSLIPLLPTELGVTRPLSACVLPSPLVEREGELFRSVLGEDATWDEAKFPTASFCRGRWARVAADHGARQLTPAECLAALGKHADPKRSAMREHESGGYEIDPVLELSSRLWERADAHERGVLEKSARTECIFPLHRNDDGTVVRVAIEDDTAFYPPQSAKRDFPLRGLRFMCHSVCWGALNKNERNSMLGDQMRVWSSLFDIKEFRFQEVMQASVLPALGLSPTPVELQWRDELQQTESLAAICQLAGAFTKPDRPLRYQRLQSDRAIFNLSRLRVPCVRRDGSEVWMPAYRVYFGKAWLGEKSFEHVLDCLPEGDQSLVEIDAHFVAPPERFLGLLDSSEDMSAGEIDDEGGSGDDEVDLDEDVDRALETTEHELWLNFLSWVGVNRSLRLVHFHDVEDRDTGWLTTKDLAQPKGWAFRDLGATWDRYRIDLASLISARPDHDEVVPYLYEVHDLDHALPLMEAAERDPSAEVASRLFEHLVLNWPTYAPMTDAQLALVDKDKWPSARSKPQRALADELTPIGDNLWLYRLRTGGFCPTSRGPRRPEVTWRRTPELERRFSSTRGRRDASDLVPVLKQSSELPANALRAFCERLGIRGELSPSTFTIEDADLLCRQIEVLYRESAGEPSALRHVIKPAYRSIFELLSGHARNLLAPALNNTPLLAETAHGFAFLAASNVLFASTPGIKERSGLTGRVPIFVLEAEPVAEAPLTSIFGCRVLEKVLDWNPNPGECPLNHEERAELRHGLRQLVVPLLARIRAERTNSRDWSDLLEFVDKMEPVDELELSCTLDGVALDRLSGRNYFVRPRTPAHGFQGFVVWTGPSWPPGPETAQSLAMALADTLGINLVETFLAFITSDEGQRRQLLDIAGASGHYRDVLDELAEQPDGPEKPEPVPAEPTAAPESGPRDERAPAGPDVAPPAAPPVPLHDFSSLLIDGEPLIIIGEETTGGPDRSGRSRGDGPPGGGRRAAAGTDLSALDALGMQIAIAYEVRRLRRLSGSVAVIAGGQIVGVGDSLVVDVHTPAAIAHAEELNDVVKRAMKQLESRGVSRLYPGFDLLSIAHGELDRLIELKSSGVDARVQAMSWNEWKSASRSDLRHRFWLYLAGNLRADLEHASPYLRAINDPFGSLTGDVVEDEQVRRVVQLRVREFATAEHLDLTVNRPEKGSL